MYAIRTYIFIKVLNRLQRGLSAIAELLVIKITADASTVTRTW